MLPTFNLFFFNRLKQSLKFTFPKTIITFFWISLKKIALKLLLKKPPFDLGFATIKNKFPIDQDVTLAFSVKWTRVIGGIFFAHLIIGIK
jgi:hypothetical protein